jgi:hypothetical protein
MANFEVVVLVDGNLKGRLVMCVGGYALLCRTQTQDLGRAGTQDHTVTDSSKLLGRQNSFKVNH